MAMIQHPMEHRSVVQHDQYGLVSSIHTPTEQRHVVQQASQNIDSHYLADAHKLYLYENPSPCLPDPHGRYWKECEMVPRDPIAQNASQFSIPSADCVPKNCAQNFPATASHAALQSQVLPPSYAQPLPASHQGELPVPHETYIPIPGRGNLSQAYGNPLQRPLPGSSNQMCQSVLIILSLELLQLTAERKVQSLSWFPLAVNY